MKEREPIELMGIPKEFLEPLGYLTLYFSRLESELDNAICDLIGVDQFTGMAITGQFTSFKIKLDMFLALIKLWIKDCPQRKHLLEVLSSAEKVNDERNKIVHGKWIGSGPAGAIKFSHTAKGKLNLSFAKKLTLGSILNTSQEAWRIAIELPVAVLECPIRKPATRRTLLKIFSSQESCPRPPGHKTRKARQRQLPPSRE